MWICSSHPQHTDSTGQVRITNITLENHPQVPRTFPTSFRFIRGMVIEFYPNATISRTEENSCSDKFMFCYWVEEYQKKKVSIALNPVKLFPAFASDSITNSNASYLPKLENSADHRGRTRTLIFEGNAIQNAFWIHGGIIYYILISFLVLLLLNVPKEWNNI